MGFVSNLYCPHWTIMIGGFVSAKKDVYSKVPKDKQWVWWFYLQVWMFILSKSKGPWIRSAGIIENWNWFFKTILLDKKQNKDLFLSRF